MKLRLNENTYIAVQMIWHNYKWLARSIEQKPNIVNTKGIGDWTYKYWDDPEDIEVIGNVYENPELLEG